MLRKDLTRIVQAAVDQLVAEGRLPSGLSQVELQDPKDPAHGDFATNFAMVNSKAAGLAPRDIAGLLETSSYEVRTTNGGESPFSSVEIAGPGFVNFRLKPEFVSAYLPGVLADGPTGFAARAADGVVAKKINVEFVSVNPNGPITIGSGRGAAYGSTLANVLAASGHTVHREYYINDGVNSEQMRLFAESVRYYTLTLAGQEAAFPERGYRGDYVEDVAGQVPFVAYNQLSQNDAEIIKQLTSYAAEFPQTDWRSQVHDIQMAFPGGANIFGAAKSTRPYFRRFGDYATSMRSSSSARMFVTTGYHTLVADLPADLIRAQNSEHPGMATEHAMYELLSIASEKARASLSRSFQASGLAKEMPTLVIQRLAEVLMIHKQEVDLRAFGVEFDTWFSEQSLHDAGVVEAELDAMIAKGAADDEPVRRKLKLAKGGVTEDVEIEAQSQETDDFEPEQTNLNQPEANPNQPESTRTNPNPSGRTLWLRSTKFGDDMDRVIRRRDGRLTYIASDVAYHKDKFNRPEGADKLITILGPDHHGYIARLHAVLAAVEMAHDGGGGGKGVWSKEVKKEEGADERPSTLNALTPLPLTPSPLTDIEAKLYTSPEERDACNAALEKARRELDVVIFQLVRFVKDGKPAPMRKRDGNIYALIDLIDEIGKKVKPDAPLEEQRKSGKDVARFFYLMRSHDTTFDFDLDLAEKQSEDNPVFYVQYAHARICSVLRKAQDAGLEVLGSWGVESQASSNTVTPQHPNTSLLSHPKETALIKQILDLPFVVARCADDYGVHRLTTYGIDLARAYHHFYDACRVIQLDQQELSQARLALCQATQVALRATFNLLGIEAPESM